MASPEIHSYETRESKNGQLIPIINNVHLHSAYNPEREAISLIQKSLDIINEKNSILLLGLGFAYHLVELQKKLKEIHKDKFHIIVVEPNKEVIKDCERFGLLKEIDRERVSIYQADQVQSFYNNKSLVKFLTMRPGIISHPASFNLYNDYFTKFLTFKSKKDIHTVASKIDDDHFRSYLKVFSSHDSLEELLKNKLRKTKEINNKHDFLMMAFDHMTKATQQLVEEK